eukprot:scaffold1325_cov138-Amphora_coffeaeformis.AAC.15
MMSQNKDKTRPVQGTPMQSTIGVDRFHTPRLDDSSIASSGYSTYMSIRSEPPRPVETPQYMPLNYDTYRHATDSHIAPTPDIALAKARWEAKQQMRAGQRELISQIQRDADSSIQSNRDKAFDEAQKLATKEEQDFDEIFGTGLDPSAQLIDKFET